MADPLLSVPGLGGYVAEDARNRGRETQDLSNTLVAAKLQEHFTGQERERAFRAKIDSLPPDLRTPEALARIGAEFAPPKDVFHYAQQSQDRKSHDEATKEMALARLQQAAATAKQTYELRAKNLTRQEDRDAMARSYQAYMANLKAQAARYSTGATIGDFEPPAMSGGAPAPERAWTEPTSRQVPPEDRAAFEAVRENAKAGITSSEYGTSGGGSADGGGGAVPAQPAAQPPAAAPDAGNLDARDIQARTALPAPQDAGGVPPPVAGATTQPAAPTAPQMPDWVKARPRKFQDQWLMQQSKPSNAGGSNMSDAAIRDLAVQSLYDPNALSGHRRDTAAMGRVAEARTKLMAEAGITSEDVVSGRAGFKADSVSLNKITPQYDAITAFEKTAVRNGKILVELGQKVDATGVPVLERWIRSGRKAIAGDTDVSKFDAQMNLYRAEAARILTQPTLSGVLTDSARHEMEAVISNNATAPQIREVVGLLERDFKNRRETMEEQIRDIRKRMRNRVSPGGESGGDEAKPSSPQKPLSEMTNAELAARAAALRKGR